MAKRWRFWFSIDNEERLAIQHASRGLIPIADYAVITQVLPDGSDGPSELAFTITAGDDEAEARQEAEGLYAAWREAAELPPGGELVAFGTVEEVAWDRALLKGADAHGMNRHEEAVVFVQIACELRATGVMRARLRSVAPEAVVAELTRRSVTLLDKRSRDLLTELTDLRVQDQDWWTLYRQHVARRNRILHEGAPVTPADAKESIGVASAFCEFVGTAVEPDSS